MGLSRSGGREQRIVERTCANGPARGVAGWRQGLMTGAGLPHFVPGPDGFDRAVFKKEAHRDLTPAAAAMTQLDATGLLSPADYVPCEASTFCRDSHAGHQIGRAHVWHSS